MNDEDIKLLNTNKKAFFDYTVTETIEAGLCLKGTEIKSLRNSSCSIKESYVIIINMEAFLCQMEIPQYKFGTYDNHEPFRKRKLLLHKKQIAHMNSKIERENFSCIPLKIYLKNGRAKILLGLGKGKKLFDKRDDIKKKSADREIERASKMSFRKTNFK